MPFHLVLMLNWLFKTKKRLFAFEFIFLFCCFIDLIYGFFFKNFSDSNFKLSIKFFTFYKKEVNHYINILLCHHTHTCTPCACCSISM
jgi:hypothetical protein